MDLGFILIFATFVSSLLLASPFMYKAYNTPGYSALWYAAAFAAASVPFTILWIYMF